MSQSIHLLVIDPQNDFCKPNGALYVGGADEDMQRLAKMVNRLGAKIDDIHVTLDSHHQIDIAHPIYWIESATGKSPSPFTIITAADVKAGKYITRHPGLLQDAINYVNTLEANGRYPLCIWPVHCDIASWGYAIHEELYAELVKWEVDNFAMVDKVTKGSNYKTEHYSAVQADVPDPDDPGTMLNTPLIKILQDADIIAIAGEALSHCVANTIRDIANNFGEDNIKKFVLLEDCTSNVAGFEFLGEGFVNEMVKRGMQISDSTKFFA